jgi:hypothetical protein
VSGGGVTSFLFQFLLRAWRGACESVRAVRGAFPPSTIAAHRGGAARLPLDTPSLPRALLYIERRSWREKTKRKKTLPLPS